ncbi:MAG: exodeoxyribonuclease III [Sphingomonadales bacterium]
MKLATFNINGVKARLPRLLEWLEEAQPDVACLQEIKSVDENFPRLEIEALGYHLETHGQKSFNGVALLSKSPMTDVGRGLPGDDTDEQARFIYADIDGIFVACLYLPNGNPTPGPKYDYKLSWMARFHAFAEAKLREERPVIFAGDYNVIPQGIDVYDPVGWQGDALFRRQTRETFRRFANLGYTDALRTAQPTGPAYTFWDYQAGAWQKDNGLRIDHIMLSPEAANLLESAGIDRAARGKEKSSDHTPVWAQLRRSDRGVN